MGASRGARIVALLACWTLFALLAGVILNLPPEAGGLAPLVREHLYGGISNPVTAVLLDFRGYDTLLEVAVLLLAFAGAGYINAREGADTVPAPHPGGPLLGSFVRWILPVMLVVAGYLLWAGATLPGGAFQSAAVLAGAALLLVFSGLAEPPAFGIRWWRVLACLGFVLFLLAAAVLLVTGGALLRYPREAAGALMLAIETGLAVSIALMLIAFFAHRRSGQ